MTIEFSDGSTTIQANALIIVKDVIRFTRDGKTVASIDAQYDTTGFPPELLDLLLQLIQQQGVNLVLPSIIAEVGKSSWLPPVPIAHAEKEPLVIKMSEEVPKPWWELW